MPFLRNKNGKDLYGPKITTLGGDGSFNVIVGTSETNLASLIIPGNTFGGRSCIKIKTRIYKTSTNAQTILTLRLGTGGTVSDTLIGSYTATSSAHQIIPMERTFCTQTTTIATIVDPNVSLSTDVGNNFSTITFTYVRSLPYTLSIWARNTSSSDTISGMYLNTKLL